VAVSSPDHLLPAHATDVEGIFSAAGKCIQSIPTPIDKSKWPFATTLCKTASGERERIFCYVVREEGSRLCPPRPGSLRTRWSTAITGCTRF
jgi:hypothetical protein